MSSRANIDDAGILRLFQRTPEHVGEVEVAEVIDSDLHLETLLGSLALWDGHDSCVVDQVIERPVSDLLLDVGHELLDRAAVCKVKPVCRYFSRP